jgi:hypothetical protein
LRFPKILHYTNGHGTSVMVDRDRETKFSGNFGYSFLTFFRHPLTPSHSFIANAYQEKREVWPSSLRFLSMFLRY